MSKSNDKYQEHVSRRGGESVFPAARTPFQWSCDTF
jgi:hypothetical protein